MAQLPRSHSPLNEIENENQRSLAQDNHPASAVDASAATASTSASAHPNSTTHCHYSVFINHRGPEVKKTFASHLYRRLFAHGLRAFLDQDELEHGAKFDSQIEGAIQKASLHVAIFSPKYADSNWCLDELVLMLNTGAPIIPVFYKVKPSELRWIQGGTGLYAQSLQRLEAKNTQDSQTNEQTQRYDSTTVESWRNALIDVAGITGFELEKFNGDEGSLLDEVVKGVLKKLKERDLYVAKYPTGLDEKVQDFEKTVLFQQQSEKPQIVGIVGLGGVGKTTFATELFNKKRSYYDRSFFLSDISESASTSSLHSLQGKLLKGLTQMDHQIDSVGGGISMLREHLSFFKVLVVLDGVDHANQVDAFLPVQTVLSSHSLILITSRDKNVLTSSGVEESAIYNLTGLDTERSEQLLCFHAFGQPNPLPGFGSLVGKFLEACDGLPLSLKVIGALLCGKNDQYWKDHLDRLRQILPHEIQKKLKISYDALHRDEQQIFLDIACFFIGKEKDMAIKIWDGSGWKGFLVFDNLEKKCLVEVDNVNRIKMHDHLRDMGRGIVEGARLPLRFWRWTDNIDDLLQQSYIEQVSTEVRGIRMVRDDNTDSDDDSPEVSSFRRWSHELFPNRGMKLCNRPHYTRYRAIGIRKLQLLDTEGELVEPILRRVHSPNLIWLRWRKCPYSSLPSWIPMENLKVLQVYGSVLKTLWHGKSKAPLQLRELGIVSPVLSKLPKSIGQLKHLERIVLKECNFKTLPEEFCQLESLKCFELSCCSKLKSLPDSFGHLRNLEHLDLSNSFDLEVLPNSFGDLIQLKYLNLKCCFNLSVSAEMLGKISPRFLDTSYCTII